jgi:hypothetical protein
MASYSEVTRNGTMLQCYNVTMRWTPAAQSYGEVATTTQCYDEVAQWHNATVRWSPTAQLTMRWPQ